MPRILDGHRLGGEGGDPFAFSERSRAIQRRRRLWKVGLNAGRLIDRIRLTYRQESDPVGDDGLANEWTEAYGGGGGDGQRLAGGRPSNGGRASSWRAGRQVVLGWEPAREEQAP